MHKYDNQLEDFFGMNPGGGASNRESFKDALSRKMQLRSRLRLLPKVLNRTERYLFLGFILLFIGSLASIPVISFFRMTVAVPADGGSLKEGIVGTPRLINPLLSQASDADRDLSALIYAGLYRYNGQGKLVPDLAESLPEITSDGLSYSVTLRQDARWHDDVPVTADDVVFTVLTARNSDYGIPAQVRVNWEGVDVEKVSDRVVIFTLKRKYAQFPNILTLGILPKHLWESVRPGNFSLSELNLKPVGSGPYRFSSLIKDDLGRLIAYKLTAWEKHHGGRPHISNLEFRFYASEDDLIAAFNNNDIDNIGTVSGSNVGVLKFRSRITLAPLKMPRYFALFFNQGQSKALADKNVRLALNYATDRVGIINKAMGGNAFLIDSPMMGGILDINPNVRTYDFDPVKAASILKAGGWVPGEDGVLTKGKDNRIELKITTSQWSELGVVARAVQEEWEKLGVKVTVETLPTPELLQVIKNRNYQVLLFGEIMSLDPDPFTTWHSSQRQDLGLNLALYKNDTVDRLIEEARATLNPLERMQKYDDLQKIVLEDIPAVFLYSPHYLYGISNRVHGFETTIIPTPEGRFTDIMNWYIDTNREFK